MPTRAENQNVWSRHSCLYGLHTVLRLHFSQEEETYFSLAP
ncbi:hypothetical protein ACFRQM_45650 [Streptomyces sp. NPDC056831]